MLTIFIILIILSLSTVTVYGSESIFEQKYPVPYYLRTQFAGNMGLLSVGAGRTFFDGNISTDFNYGFLPEKVNGAKVHTFALKASYNLPTICIFKLKTGCYLGASLTYSITKNTYLNYPDYYPDKYYGTNAIHFNPYLGAIIEIPCKFYKLDVIRFYGELGTVDYKIWYGIKNKTIKPDDIWNLCFGMTFHLK